MNGRFDAVDARIAALETRVDVGFQAVNSRLGRIETRVEALEEQR